MRTTQVLIPVLAAAICIPLSAYSNPTLPTVRKPLSRVELRTCIQREEELGRRQDGVRQAQDEHQLSSAKLSAEAIELSRILRATDPNDAAAVDLYNQRNDARNAQVDTHNRRAEALNAVLADLQEAEADFLATCASRPFLQSDESAVLKELGLKERRYDRERRQGPTRPVGKSAT
jgi:hypothetical protein